MGRTLLKPITSLAEWSEENRVRIPGGSESVRREPVPSRQIRGSSITTGGDDPCERPIVMPERSISQPVIEQLAIVIDAR